jgi:phosphoribosylaminoimidazolecarboxamide formyltransferase / IMP cyclohydrolase
MSNVPIRRAVISVSDKQDLAEFARGLHAAGVELYSTGGTRRYLEEAGLPVIDVAAYTGFPEMLDGRVKTLHPRIFAGILCRHDHPEDLETIAAHDIRTFELVVVNLYPFEATVARPDATFEQAIENVDIGGPSLVRAAAKNHAFTTICTDPSQYAAVLAQIVAGGSTTLDLRRRLMAEAYAHTANYDRAIAAHFGRLILAPAPEAFPERISIDLKKVGSLRYGENPHQGAALYGTVGTGPSLVDAEQLNGKELSYNNWLDLDAARRIVHGLPDAAVTVIKHNNPCGAASAIEIADACRAAMEGDPLSAFGSILGFNRPVDEASARFLATPGLFVEAIVAPDFTPEALRILTTEPKWKSNVRLVRCRAPFGRTTVAELRQLDGGFLMQDADLAIDDPSTWQVVTAARPDQALLSELQFGWAICRYVKSNAITVSRGRALCGAGAGQMSRVDSVEIALRKSGERCRGAVLASDAFFPFPDSVQLAADAGIAALIQPGGSKNDAEVIKACDARGLPMIFTGVRHFRH